MPEVEHLLLGQVEVDVTLQKRRLQLDGAPVGLAGFGVAADLEVEIADVVVRAGIPGRQLGRPEVLGQRFLQKMSAGIEGP